MTNDHLGSPRVITNQLGAVTTRKDYMAFGEETYTAQRTSSLNYDNQSETRKGYTGYEKDDESGLDFAQARYYNSKHGRFTSVDPLMASANVKNPQTFNRYSYVLNSPYKFTDPLGLISSSTGANGGNAWCSTCESRDENGNWTPDPVEASASDSNSNAAGTSPASTSTAAGEPPAQQADPPVAPPPPAAEQNAEQTRQTAAPSGVFYVGGRPPPSDPRGSVDEEQQKVMVANSGEMPSHGLKVGLAAHGSKPKSAAGTFTLRDNVYIVTLIKPGQVMYNNEGQEVDKIGLEGAKITLLPIEAVIGPGKQMLNMIISPIGNDMVAPNSNPFRVIVTTPLNEVVDQMVKTYGATADKPLIIYIGACFR